MTIVRDCMFPDLITLSPSTTLLDAMRRLLRQPFGFAVILDNMAPVGLVTEFDLLRWMVAGHDLAKATFAQFTLSIPQIVREDTPCQSLLNIYNNRRFRRFPVLNDENMLSGGITEKQIVASLPRSELMAHYRVSDIIQSRFPAVSSDLPFQEAARQMVSWHRGCLLLSDGEQLLGMVTEGDLLRFRISADWHADAPLSLVPSSEAITIEPDRNLLYALDLFVRSGHRRIPVVARDALTGVPRKLVGLLTQTDLLKQVVNSARTHKAILNPEDINDPAIWFEPSGGHRILALNEKGAAALELDNSWVGRSVHDLARDPDIWGAITILLHNCGTMDRISLPLRTGSGSAICSICRFSLVHTPTGEDRIFWTLHGSESGRSKCG
ncbi:CBS domain-containing protein [Candidatus Magnetaquicoccus inordinatus]|uniref:CBS domain-containing protein n=1 Tax=Candidatus Magnetaquicoccus inordinatus TaxID=2496818 RepID=UPI00102AE608|nr:CBS domain-containing protein [Candidatus Magnetaquicoccus inordinatus]